MAATGTAGTGAAARTEPASPAAGGEGAAAAGGWRLFGSPLCGAEGLGRAVRAGRCSMAGCWHCALSIAAPLSGQVAVGLRGSGNKCHQGCSLGKRMSGWQNGVPAVLIPILRTAEL